MKTMIADAVYIGLIVIVILVTALNLFAVRRPAVGSIDFCIRKIPSPAAAEFIPLPFSRGI
jgi:hypothetical protein